MTADRSDFLESLIGLLHDQGIRYCFIGGQGVNAYVEPLVSLDLDLVIASEQLPLIESLLSARYEVERFPHSLNVSAAGSNLRVQIETDPRYFEFLDRASPREILGVLLLVAALEDVLQGKIWATRDEDRSPSKRRKDLLDIERILETRPELRGRVPSEILSRLS